MLFICHLCLSQVWLHKMDLRVTSVLFVLLALVGATPDRYQHHKVSKSYPVKAHHVKTQSESRTSGSAPAHLHACTPLTRLACSPESFKQMLC